MKDKRNIADFFKNNGDKINSFVTLSENKIFKCLISFILIILMLFWGVIPSIILAILKINPDNLSLLVKGLITFINDLLFLGILLKLYYKDLKKNLFDYFNKSFSNNLKTSIGYWLIGFVIMLFSNFIIAIVTGGQLAENEETVRSMIDKIPLYMAFQVMIYAPLTEELIFRKSLRDVFNNKWIYAIISGCIFGGLHAISSITNLVSLLYLIPYCSLGIVFGLLYFKTNNIFSTIVIHAIHNSLAFFIYLSAL